MGQLGRFVAASVVGFGMLLCPPAVLAEPAPVFSDVSFEEGKAASLKDGKIFVVKATAEWCPPCKMIDKTTFRDEKVAAWFKENGLVIQLDVDKEPDLAAELDVGAMPTMIAFRGGEEFDRVVGYRDAEGMLEWLEAVGRGESSADAAAKRLEKARRGEVELSVRDRMELARSLVAGGKHERATEEYAWLWENAHKKEPSMIGVRGSFLASMMTELASEHEPARERFAAMRDDLEERLRKGERTWRGLDDWIVLNGVVGEEHRTLEWFDRIKDDEDAGRTLERFAFRLEDLLEREERWADLGRIVRNPVLKVQSDHAMLQMMNQMSGAQENGPEMKEIAEHMFRDSIAKLYAGLLAGGRESDAAAVADEAFKRHDTPRLRVEMAAWALKVGRVRPPHLEWLNDAERNGAEVDAATRSAIEQAVGRN